MAYLTVLSQHFRDLSPINSTVVQFRNLKTPYRPPATASLLFPSPSSHSKILTGKKSPDLINNDKKNTHSSSAISKSRTLPYLKSAETESEVKFTEKSILEHFPAKKNRVKISIKNNKVKSLLKSFQQQSPKIEITITTCQDLAPKVKLTSVSSKTLNSRGSSPCDSSYNKESIKRSGISSPVLPISVIKRHIDPYHYFDYVKHTNVTGFPQLIEGLSDSNIPAYPYMARVLKCFPKLKPSLKPKKESEAKSFFECSCQHHSQDIKKNRLPKIKEIKLLISSLHLEQFSPQSPVFPNCFIVVNFENVIGCYKNDLRVKPGILTFIKKLSKYFRVVLVHSLDGKKSSSVNEFFQEKGVLLSGVYRTIHPAQDFWEIRNMQDYSEIFKDFDVRNPESQVLVFCAHKIADSSINLSEMIVEKRGLSLKLNIERVPIPLQEFQRPPITVLVQNFMLRKHSETFRRILTDLRGFRKSGESVSDFRKIFLGTDFYECDKIHRIWSDCLRGFRSRVKTGWKARKDASEMLFCKLHNKQIQSIKEKFCDNIFIT